MTTPPDFGGREIEEGLLEDLGGPRLEHPRMTRTRTAPPGATTRRTPREWSANCAVRSSYPVRTCDAGPTASGCMRSAPDITGRWSLPEGGWPGRPRRPVGGDRRSAASRSRRSCPCRPALVVDASGVSVPGVQSRASSGGPSGLSGHERSTPGECRPGRAAAAQTAPGRRVLRKSGSGQAKAAASGVRRSTSSGPARSGRDTNTVRTPRSASSR